MESPEINSTIFNLTYWQETGDYTYDEQTIIRQGTVVYNQAIKCDGAYECLDFKDELYCGFNTFETFFIGNLNLKELDANKIRLKLEFEKISISQNYLHYDIALFR